MVYFRVKKESDNVTHQKGFLVGNELLTQKEINKLGLSDKFVSTHFNKVEVSKFETYFSFGARFENGKGVHYVGD